MLVQAHLYGGLELALAERLEQIAERACRFGAAHGAVVRVGAEEDDRDVEILAQLFGRLDTVEIALDVDIHEHQIDSGVFFYHLDTLLAVGGVDDVELLALQQAGHGKDITDVVVDNQHFAARQRRVLSGDLLEHLPPGGSQGGLGQVQEEHCLGQQGFENALQQALMGQQFGQQGFQNQLQQYLTNAGQQQQGFENQALIANMQNAGGQQAFQNAAAGYGLNLGGQQQGFNQQQQLLQNLMGYGQQQFQNRLGYEQLLSNADIWQQIAPLLGIYGGG